MSGAYHDNYNMCIIIYSMTEIKFFLNLCETIVFMSFIFDGSRIIGSRFRFNIN
mgnify:FL=1